MKKIFYIGDFMSVGLCGFCRKFIEDSEFVIYEYYSRDMNNKNFLDDDKNFDGFITIRKNFLLSPESDEKSTKSKKINQEKIVYAQMMLYKLSRLFTIS